MTSTEAVSVVHQMMADREREMREMAVQTAVKEYDPGATRRAFWKEVAVYPLTLVCAAAYALLMAVAQ